MTSTAGRVRIPIISAARGPLHLDASASGWTAVPADVAAAARTAPEATEILLCGGEPTLHPELPDILDLLAGAGMTRCGIATDGLALTDRRRTRDLIGRGLGFVVLQFYCARATANDFVAGTPGAAKRAVLAARACVDLGLEVEAEVTVTRPTAAHLSETVAVLRRVGIRRIGVAWAQPGQVGEEHAPALIARMLTQSRHVSAAVTLAAQLDVRLALAGVPPCLRAACGDPKPAPDAWILPRPRNGSNPPVTGHGPGEVVPCDRCDGAFDCPGAPAEYVRSFGWLEIDTALARRRG